MPAGRRSMRAQLLLNAINAAQNSAFRDDYLNAVTNMIAAAESADFRLPPKPHGVPEIVRGDAWKKWRSYYHNNFPTVHKHVNEVLKKLNKGSISVVEEGEDDE